MSEGGHESNERPAAPIGIVVVTHGQLATELVNAAEMIAGDRPHVAAVSIGWHDDSAAALDAIRNAVSRVDGGCGVLVLTDMFGGTPANLSMTLLSAGHVEVVTGVNLPMLVKALRSTSLAEAAREIAESGRGAIWVTSDLMHAQGRS